MDDYYSYYPEQKPKSSKCFSPGVFGGLVFALLLFGAGVGTGIVIQRGGFTSEGAVESKATNATEDGKDGILIQIPENGEILKLFVFIFFKLLN